MFGTNILQKKDESSHRRSSEKQDAITVIPVSLMSVTRLRKHNARLQQRGDVPYDALDTFFGDSLI